MLNPSDIADAIAAALANMDGIPVPDSSVTAFHYLLGSDRTLEEAIWQMSAPSILVVWRGTDGGNFDGAHMFRHKFDIHFRMANAGGNDDPISYEDLWQAVCNTTPGGWNSSIRYSPIMDGCEIMDTPSCEWWVDRDGSDRFKGRFVIPEIGDQGLFA